MLDKKTENYDASLELLEDRQKSNKYIFLFLYIVGAFVFILSPFFVIISIGTSILFLLLGILSFTVASFFLMLFLQYCTYIFLIKKGLIKTEKERK